MICKSLATFRMIKLVTREGTNNIIITGNGIRKSIVAHLAGQDTCSSI